MMQQFHYQIQGKKCVFFLDAEIDGLLTQIDNKVIVTDENIQAIYGHKWIGAHTLVMPPGEQAKTPALCFDFLDKLLSWEITADVTIIGIGGGVVTDMAGFIASVYKRGLPLILVPTSLLAMVDASIGGKNGLNAGAFKNMIGTIYQPEQIWIDIDFLKTLPQEEWENGMAEVIKHAWIADAEMLQTLEDNSWDSLKTDRAMLAGLIKKNMDIKMRIVISDPTDKRERKWLNFGHTLAHAFELHAGMPHGKAVAVGMMAVMKYAQLKAGFDSSLLKRMKNILQQYGLPIHAELQKDVILNAVIHDKKRSTTAIQFVLLKDIGNPILFDVSLDSLNSVLQEMLSC